MGNHRIQLPLQPLPPRPPSPLSHQPLNPSIKIGSSNTLLPPLTVLSNSIFTHQAPQLWLPSILINISKHPVPNQQPNAQQRQPVQQIVPPSIHSITVSISSKTKNQLQQLPQPAVQTPPHSPHTHFIPFHSLLHHQPPRARTVS